MAGLKQIKSKIRSVEKTQKVTKAMGAVSAAKMRKAQNRALGGRAYARAALSILARVSGSQELSNHPLAQSRIPQSEGRTWASAPERPSGRDSARVLYIVITSDKGLAGALNSAVLRATLVHIEQSTIPHEHISIIAVGRKANDFFLVRGFAVEAYHPNTDISSELIDALVREAAERFALRAVDAVHIAYQNFVSTFEQRPTLRTVFPLSITELQKVVGDILPAKGAFAGSQTFAESLTSVNNYTIEPGEAEVLDAILPKLAGVFVYHALLESQASEHSARMVAMKSASDKAGEMEHDLTLSFNKVRQAAITREVSEIIGGMETLV